MLHTAKPLFSHRPYWAHRFGVSAFLPTTRAEMDELGWDSCDVVMVTGDAYVDHPSFGAALIGRLLESHGFRVGIIAQPDWRSTADFERLGRPNLYYGVTAGNMDSMVNRYTSERKVRSDDAYTPGGRAHMRPNRAAIVYAQRCRQAHGDVPIVLGGIEASLRRIAHYDYWSDKVRRSILLDSQADLLVYGSGERSIVEITHRLAANEPIGSIDDLRGTAFLRRGLPPGFVEIDSTTVDTPGPVDAHRDPYSMAAPSPDQPGSEGGEGAERQSEAPDVPLGQLIPITRRRALQHPRERSVIRIPGHDQVKADPVLYAHASRILHLESNAQNARALVQRHGDWDVWLNPPPLPLTTPELDRVFELPYARVPHPAYGDAKIPAYDMIRFSVTITRGCFGGCSFCSITEHEGRVIQNRSEESVVREIETIRDRVPGFTGVISDLGGPTANMYRIACKDPRIEAACRRPSCVFPGVCENLNTSHDDLIKLYRRARKVKGVKKVLVASGVRYDLAVESPAYIKELVTHHVGGRLKIAPEHTREGPLSHMMKPGIGTYDRFKELFDRYSKEAGKEQYLVPYFIAAHPGTTDEDMLHLALWLKRKGFRVDQVQAFLPSPMATATAMYYSGKNPLRKLRRDGGDVTTPKDTATRRLHKAFLRYHDAENWPILRDALRRMGRADLIGGGPGHLIPRYQPAGTGRRGEGIRTKQSAARSRSEPRGPVRRTGGRRRRTRR